MNTASNTFLGICTWCSLAVIAAIGVASAATLIWVLAL